MKITMAKFMKTTLKLIRKGIRFVTAGTAACLVIVPAYFSVVFAQDGNSEMKFEVLDVTTGSGSKPKNAGEMPTAELPPETVSSETNPTLNLDPEDDKKRALYAALDRWQNKTLAGYDYSIGNLQDPFLPIKEVRGQPPAAGPGPDDITLPPILRLDLNQLKLVAITILSDRPGGALVSFEDGAGASYILRQGDRIGRYKGRITKIEPSLVIVEEPDRLGPGQPQINEIKLNVLDTSTGVTRESMPEEGLMGLEQTDQQGQVEQIP